MSDTVGQPWTCLACDGPGLDLRGHGFNHDQVTKCFRWSEGEFECRSPDRAALVAAYRRGQQSVKAQAWKNLPSEICIQVGMSRSVFQRLRSAMTVRALAGMTMGPTDAFSAMVLEAIDEGCADVVIESKKDKGVVAT